MNGIFSSPKTPKITPQEQVEEVQKVADDASAEQERAKKRILQSSGKQSTMIAGIANALKKRLG